MEKKKVKLPLGIVNNTNLDGKKWVVILLPLVLEIFNNIIAEDNY